MTKNMKVCIIFRWSMTNREMHAWPELGTRNDFVAFCRGFCFASFRRRSKKDLTLWMTEQEGQACMPELAFILFLLSGSMNRSSNTLPGTGTWFRSKDMRGDPHIDYEVWVSVRCSAGCTDFSSDATSFSCKARQNSNLSSDRAFPPGLSCRKSMIALVGGCWQR